jgi:hypothetical protein
VRVHRAAQLRKLERKTSNAAYGAKAHSLCDFILLGGDAFAPVLLAFIGLTTLLFAVR